MFTVAFRWKLWQSATSASACGIGPWASSYLDHLIETQKQLTALCFQDLAAVTCSPYSLYQRRSILIFSYRSPAYSVTIKTCDTMENLYFLQAGRRTTAAPNQDGCEIAHFPLWTLMCDSDSDELKPCVLSCGYKNNASHLIATVKTQQINQYNSHGVVWMPHHYLL